MWVLLSAGAEVPGFRHREGGWDAGGALLRLHLDEAGWNAPNRIIEAFPFLTITLSMFIEGKKRNRNVLTKGAASKRVDLLRR